MLTPPRFVILDDTKAHLTPLIKAFQDIGTSCIGIEYDLESDAHLSTELYRGVRGFFTDLHLTSGAVGGNSKQHYSEILRTLQTVITKDNGPFILILWTEYDQECTALMQYIDKELEVAKPYCRPLLIKPLSKSKYINIDKNSDEYGLIIQGKESEFKETIKSFFTSVPQIAALFDWEDKIFEAVNQTLIELLNLIPTPNRTLSEYPSAIDKVLSCITRETVGEGHVNTDPRQAFNIAIAPILLDNLLNNHAKEEQKTIWQQAITKVSSDDSKITDPKSVGQYNKMLHLAVSGHENIQTIDWGAVLTPKNWSNEITTDLFGLTTDQIKNEVFKIKPDHSSTFEPVFARLGAVCDYAQQKEGLIPYYLGFKLSLDEYNKNKNKNDFEWKSPLFYVQGDEHPFYLIFNLKYLLTLPKHRTNIFTVKYRIREQLLNQLILRASNHASRPGITELFVSK